MPPVCHPEFRVCPRYAFTYQGQLENEGTPASGSYSLMFALYATNTGGTTVSGFMRLQV